MTVFGDRLRQLRRNSGMSQKDLASSIGVTERAFRFYESGDREPTIEQLVKLADIFNVSLDYMTGRTNDPTPPKKD
ncbi:MAG TPA: helix-turn-helix transcriptional regulator [Alicyclobacillus sp.]|nr:helix-turn-helix transcriptional regulator [Alicyclobacillus sp.]